MKVMWRLQAASCPERAQQGNAASTCIAGIETACQTGTQRLADDNCDGIDDNCNGSVDEGYVAVTSCFLPGACAAGNAGIDLRGRH